MNCRFVLSVLAAAGRHNDASGPIIEWFVGITFDEGVSFGGNYGPYRQSERQRHLQNLRR